MPGLIRILAPAAVVTCAALLIQKSPEPGASGARNRARIPLAIEANRGQADPAARYLARSGGRSSYFTAAGLVLDCGVRIRFQGGKLGEPEALEPLGSTSNYLIGRDSRKWVTGVPHYGRVRYRNVYPGIDVIYYPAGSSLEYDLVLGPGANPADIRLEFEGARDLRIESGGELVVSGPRGELRQHLPNVYQSRNGRRSPVRCRQARVGPSTVGFQVEEYDAATALTIDPVLSWSTLLGGGPSGDIAGQEGAIGVGLDRSGNVYVAGTTSSPNFPTVTPIQSAPGKVYLSVADIFVAKLSPDGSRLIYSTYVGGSFIDTPHAMAVDSEGSVYVAGDSESDDFPVAAAYQSASRGGVYPLCSPRPCGIQDAILFRLTPSGTAFVYSTYLGGSYEGYEFVSGLAIDADGNAYVTGTTSSRDFPVTRYNAYQKDLAGGQDAFVAKFSATGQSLMFATLLGGKGTDYGTGIALDSQGNVIVTGYTNSSDISASPEALQKTTSGTDYDGFVAKLGPGGNVRTWFTFLGGSASDNTRTVQVDASDNIYVTGSTSSSNFPTTAGAFQASAQNRTAGFVSKINPAGSSLLYSTNLAATGSFTTVTPSGLRVDSQGRAYVVGTASSTSFPLTADAFQPGPIGTTSYSTPFFSILKPAGDGLEYSTLLDASGFTQISGLAIDASRNIYLVGYTAGVDFPTTAGAYQRKLNLTGTGAASDAFILRMAGTKTGPLLGAVTHSATFATGGISPGEIVTAWGSGFGPSAVTYSSLDPAGYVPTSLSNAAILFNDVPAPVISGMADRLSVVVPYSVAGKAGVIVTAQFQGVKSNALWIPVVAAAPGIFTAEASGKGPAAALNTDYSINSASNPAGAGSVVMFYVTGEGETDPAGVDGKPANDVYPKPKQSVAARIGGKTADVQYAGAAPGFVAGAMQVNLMIPSGLAAGAQSVTITVGGKSSQSGVTVAVK